MRNSTSSPTPLWGWPSLSVLPPCHRGNIFVANHGDGMLVELDAKGAFQRTVDTELGDNRLLSVAVRSGGSVFIVDDEGGFGSLYRVMLP